MNKFDKYVNAIKELYPNALVTNENSEGVYISEDGNGNVIEVNETEITNKIAEIDADKETKKQADATNKATGNQKLLDLGLTQAEATALTGYTPPVSEE